jgi:hypothetical protein
MRLVDGVAKENGITGKPVLVARGAASRVYRAGTSAIKVLIAGRGTYERQLVNGRRAAQRELGPEPLTHGTAEGTPYLIERWQPGTRLEAGAVTARQAEGVAAFYTRLYRLDRGERVAAEAVRARVHSYREVVQGHHSAQRSLTTPYNATVKRALACETLLTDHVERHLKVLLRERSSMRHGDSNPKNFFWYRGGIQAIDWVGGDGPLFLDTSDFLCKARLDAKAEAAFLNALPKNLREATVVWQPVRAYTAVWWDLDEAYRNRIEKQPTVRSYEGNLRHANTVLARIERHFRTGQGVVL